MISVINMENDGGGKPDFNAMMTRKEVAKRLRICPHTVRIYELRGYLYPIRISARTIRYRASEVEDLLAKFGGRKN